MGIGRRIHGALEGRAVSWGLSRLDLESTVAARKFYESLGYEVAGPERSLFGVLNLYPYAKELQRNISFQAIAFDRA